MRSKLHFQRILPTPAAPKIALGADADPRTTPPTTRNNPSGENTSADPSTLFPVFSSKAVTGVGWPVQRVGIGYTKNGGTGGGDLPATIYLYDSVAGIWFQADSITLKCGQIIFTKGVVVSIDEPPNSGDMAAPASLGALEMYVQVAIGSESSGTYDFYVYPDIGS